MSILGTNDNDTLTGTLGDDEIQGLGGNDLIEGLAGNDTLDGGEGADRLNVDLNNVTSDLTLDLRVSGVNLTGDSQTSISNFEQLGIINTGSGNDLIQGQGTDTTAIATGAGDDIIDLGDEATVDDDGSSVDGGTGRDLVIVDFSNSDRSEIDEWEQGIYTDNERGFIQTFRHNIAVLSYSNLEQWNLTGTRYNDSLDGFEGNDTLDGHQGNDTLFGNGGDILDGGEGADRLNVDLNNVTSDLTLDLRVSGVNLTGDSQTSISNFEQLGIINTGSGNDLIQGQGTDTTAIATGAGDDIIDLGDEATVDDDGSSVDGGTGRDLVIVDFSNSDRSEIDEWEQGIYTDNERGFIQTFRHNIAVLSYSNLEQWNLTGTRYNDSLHGFEGNDTLDGHQGNDTLFGNGGDDIISGVNPYHFRPGQEEIDTVTGGNGRDLFLLGNNVIAFYDDNNASTNGTSDYLTITDFNPGEDTIQLYGDKSNYRLDNSPFENIFGTAIYLIKPGDEPDELIGVLSNVAPSDLDLDSDTFITAVDEIAFTQPDFIVDENGTTSANITLNRTFGSQGEVTVDLRLSDGTATAGEDYNNRATRITFADGQQIATASIPIIDNDLLEGNETVNLALSNPTDPASLGTQNTAILTIVDDDYDVNVNNNSVGYYNEFLGNIFDAPESGNSLPEPDLTSITDLGDWLNDPVSATNNGLWNGLQPIPQQWDINRETAIIYEIDGGESGVSDLIGNFGVDNSIFVWVNGEYKFGASAEEGSRPHEYANINLGDLTPGTNYIQVLRADHGVETDYYVNISGKYNELQPTLTITSDRDSISETDTATITITRDGDNTNPLTINLTSSDTTQATVPETVTIAAGETSVTAMVTGVNDNISDGDRSVTITATASGLNSVDTTLDIIDVVDIVPTIENEINGTSDDDPIIGTIEADLIDGLAGDDTINAKGGDDYIIAGGGSDRVFGLAGADTIEGDAGEDLILGGFDNDSIKGGEDNDQLFGEGGDDFIDGGDGNDYLAGAVGNDYLVGGEGDDDFTGAAGNDTIEAGAGNDRIFAMGDDDLVYAGTGDDVVIGNDGMDTIYGEDGSDLINGGLGEDQIYGGEGIDRIYGFDDDDTIYGEEDNDLLLGNLGDDSIDGGSGNDNIFGEEGADTLVGGEGSDTLTSGIDDDLVFGDEGNDNINAGAGNDTVYGGLGDDSIFGLQGDDVMSGEAGSDVLIGGDGADTFVIQLGEGTDIFGDFIDGTDNLGLADGLTFEELNVVGDSSRTLIQDLNSNTLAILSGVDASSINGDDFTTV